MHLHEMGFNHSCGTKNDTINAAQYDGIPFGILVKNTSLTKRLLRSYKHHLPCCALIRYDGTHSAS